MIRKGSGGSLAAMGDTLLFAGSTSAYSHER